MRNILARGLATTALIGALGPSMGAPVPAAASSRPTITVKQLLPTRPGAAHMGALTAEMVTVKTRAPVTIRRALTLLTRKAGSVNGPADASCWPVTFQSAANGRYVSAELGYRDDNYGMLRARADQIGPWEQYGLCTYGDHYVFGSVANGKWVSAELAWRDYSYGMLRARADQIGPWEQYDIWDSNGAIAIRSVANGKYVSAELGWRDGFRAGMLRARADQVGPWERFY